MQSTTLLETEPTTICPAVAIWPLPAFWLDEKTSAASDDTEPFPPQFPVVEWIGADNFRVKAGQPEGEPITLRIAPADVAPEKIESAPVIPEEDVATPASYARPGNPCEPGSSGIGPIDMLPEAGRMDRDGHFEASTLQLPSPVGREPQVETEAWRAGVLKPSEPAPGETLRLVMREQAGSAAAARQKQALRELIMPSPRPWHSLSVRWESLNGFHFAMPPSETKTGVRLPFPTWTRPWNALADADLPARRFLEQSEEIVAEPAVSLEGAHTSWTPSQVPQAKKPFVPGLKEPQSIRKALNESNPFPQTPLYETLPVAMDPETVAPDEALPGGLMIWTGVTNSYRRRFWSLPRLREGGRTVHMLQLAPSMDWNEPAEISTEP